MWFIVQGLWQRLRDRSRWFLFHQSDSGLATRCHGLWLRLWYWASCLCVFLSLIHHSLCSNAFGRGWRCLWLGANTYSLNRLSLRMRVLQSNSWYWFIFIINLFHIFILDLNREIFCLSLLSNLLRNLRHDQLFLFNIWLNRLRMLWYFLIACHIWRRATLVILNLLLINLLLSILCWWEYAKVTFLTTKPELLSLLNRWWRLWPSSATNKFHFFLLFQLILAFVHLSIIYNLRLWLLLKFIMCAKAFIFNVFERLT